MLILYQLHCETPGFFLDSLELPSKSEKHITSVSSPSIRGTRSTFFICFVVANCNRQHNSGKTCNCGRGDVAAEQRCSRCGHSGKYHIPQGMLFWQEKALHVSKRSSTTNEKPHAEIHKRNAIVLKYETDGSRGITMYFFVLCELTSGINDISPRTVFHRATNFATPFAFGTGPSYTTSRDKGQA